MPDPRVLILRAPGTNCDGETAHAFSLAGGRVDVLAMRAASNLSSGLRMCLRDRSQLDPSSVNTDRASIR